MDAEWRRDGMRREWLVAEVQRAAILMVPGGIERLEAGHLEYRRDLHVHPDLQQSCRTRCDAESAPTSKRWDFTALSTVGR